MPPRNSLVAVMAAGIAPRTKAQTLSAVESAGGGWFGLLRESYGGAFQANVTVDSQRSILAYSAVFSSVTLIASDIAKLGSPGLTVEGVNGIHSQVKGNSPFLPVLRKPNRYQTWFKFIEQWIVSKLLYGNTFVLKQRDARGIVTDLYILHAERVTPLVADDGSVYYKLSQDYLSGLQDPITVPASEIIHDTMVSLWHPLIGVSPIYACGLSATQGNRIQANSTHFFANASRPSGMLTAPGVISDETANRLKKAWDENYGGANIGRLAVLGDGLTYLPMTIPAAEAQLIEQLKWTVEDVARCFHIPMWKLGDKEPLRTSVESLNQTYYSDCLQQHIESVEALLDDGLGLLKNAPVYHAEFSLDPLLRMDTAARFLAWGQAVKDGWWAPDEARAKEDMQPVSGGATPYLQQQNYSLAALAKRDAKADPFTAAPKPESTAPAVPTTDQAANDAQAAAQAAAKTLEEIQRVVAEQKADAQLRMEAEEQARRERLVAEANAAAEREEAARVKREADTLDDSALADVFIKGLEAEYAPA